MSKILSTGMAMASLLFATCGTPELTSTEAPLQPNSECQGTACIKVLQPGDACGGIQGNNNDCGANAYCAYPISLQCGAGDQQGVCTLRPDFCPHGIRYDAMCGCDGETYDGGCNAALAGTSVQRVGSCEQNVTGSWSYTADRQYSYTFDPDGSFARTVRPSCAPALPCPLYLIESAGNYNLQGTRLNLLYTSNADQGKTAELTIHGQDQAAHLQGTDDGVYVDLTHTY